MKPSIIASNVVLITSGQPPTIFNLPIGHLAYGKMDYDGEYHIFLNSGTDDGVIDFHNPLMANVVLLRDGASIQDKFDIPFNMFIDDGILNLLISYGVSTVNPFIVEGGIMYFIPNDVYSVDQFVIEDGVLYYKQEVT